MDPIPEAELPDLDDPDGEPVPPAAVRDYGPALGQRSAERPPIPPTGILIEPAIESICNTFDRYARGWAEGETAPRPPAPITPDERRMMAETYGLLLDKYAPFLAKYALEINGLIVTLTVLLPRIVEGRRYIKWRNDQSRPAGDDARPPGAPPPSPRDPATPAPVPTTPIVPATNGTNPGDVTNAYERALAKQQEKEAELNPRKAR